MDEVDKIILHSLRQVGCTFDDSFSMVNFTSESLVQAVAFCLDEIKPGEVHLRRLPESMAQRFTVAAVLADQCAACGYRSDIGYQTFLYPNTIDIRRLLMFLIEQLPKDNRIAPETTNQNPIRKYEALRNHIQEKMLKQMKSPWLPQFCRCVGNRRFTDCSSHSTRFVPHLNLNFLGIQFQSSVLHNYLQQQAPSVFQQTATKDLDLISSVVHKNAIDLHSTTETVHSFKFPLYAANAIKVLGLKRANNVATDKSVNVYCLTPIEQLNNNVIALKCQNETLISNRKNTSTKISGKKNQQSALDIETEKLRKNVKILERTCVILDNPLENVVKLEGLIQTAQERRKALKLQWQTYRQPIAERQKQLQTAKQAKNIQSVIDLRRSIVELEQALEIKTTRHTHLSSLVKSGNMDVAPRKEYTRRILEFIGNIRKQRNDISKVLDDTRDLQKQLNSVSVQLQRQFNYTDDLLFQSAKHDLHAKKAYKLLASLHITCNELVELVSQTGNINKEIRDIEVQIDCEKLKNIASSLEQISADINNFENVVKRVQTEIRKVENEIISV